MSEKQDTTQLCLVLSGTGMLTLADMHGREIAGVTQLTIDQPSFHAVHVTFGLDEACGVRFGQPDVQHVPSTIAAWHASALREIHQLAAAAVAENVTPDSLRSALRHANGKLCEIAYRAERALKAAEDAHGG